MTLVTPVLFRSESLTKIRVYQKFISWDCHVSPSVILGTLKTLLMSRNDNLLAYVFVVWINFSRLTLLVLHHHYRQHHHHHHHLLHHHHHHRHYHHHRQHRHLLHHHHHHRHYHHHRQHRHHQLIHHHHQILNHHHHHSIQVYTAIGRNIGEPRRKALVARGREDHIRQTQLMYDPAQATVRRDPSVT